MANQDTRTIDPATRWNVRAAALVSALMSSRPGSAFVIVISKCSVAHSGDLYVDVEV